MLSLISCLLIFYLTEWLSDDSRGSLSVPFDSSANIHIFMILPICGPICDLLLHLMGLVLHPEAILKPGQFFIIKAHRCWTLTEEKPRVLKTNFALGVKLPIILFCLGKQDISLQNLPHSVVWWSKGWIWPRPYYPSPWKLKTAQIIFYCALCTRQFK